MAKRINVTVTAYDADPEFPEADSYPDFVADRLADLYGAEVDCSIGLCNRAFLYGFEGDDRREDELTHEIMSLVKVDLWDEFCAEGYKAYTATATTMNANDLIALSRREHRTVTEYPRTADEERTLLDDLMSSDDYQDSADVSGEGHSGSEARGYVELWGGDWRITVVHAAA